MKEENLCLLKLIQVFKETKKVIRPAGVETETVTVRRSSPDIKSFTFAFYSASLASLCLVIGWF